MPNRPRWMPLVPLVLVLSSCTVGHRVTRLAGKVDAARPQAAYYALPRTVVTVSFPATKAEIKRGTGTASDGTSCFDHLGDGEDFPRKLKPGEKKKPTLPAFHLWEAIGLDKKPEVGPVYAVDGTPTIGSLAEPDPAQVFRVDLDSSWATKRLIELAYGRLGILESGTSFVQDRRVDLSLAVVRAAAAFSFTFDTTERPLPPARDVEFRCEDATDPCQRAACEIYEARRALAALPARVATEDLSGPQVEWLEKRYTAEIDKRLPVFLRPKTEKATVVCAARPATGTPNSKAEDLPVLKLAPKEGFMPAANAGCLVPHGFGAPKGAKEASSYAIAVGPVAGQYAGTLFDAGLPGAHKDGKEQGFYYRVPALATVELTMTEAKNTDASAATAPAPHPTGSSGASKAASARETVAASQLVVAQLGFVAALPKQSTYQTQYKITLDPETGALKTLQSSSDSVDPALITGTGDAIAAALTRRAEAEKAEAAAQDELALLERERKILEETKKIRDLKKELGETEPPL